MNNGNAFSWISFLLGLAIGLWISVAGLFLMDRGSDCDCGPPGATVNNFPGQYEAWIPGGNGNYYATNNDEGRGIVVDEGRAVVADEGRSTVPDEGRSSVPDEGRSTVPDQGRAVVVNQGGFVPAPNAEQLSDVNGRGFEDFKATTNNEGGAIIVDRANRIAVVSMPNGFAKEQCVRLNSNARVLDENGKLILVDYNGDAIQVGNGDLQGDAEAKTEIFMDPDSPRSEKDLAYCMVALEDSEPIVIRPPEPSS